MDGENNGKPWKINMEPTNLPKTYDICSMLIFRGVCLFAQNTKNCHPKIHICRYDINSCNYEVLRVVFSNNPTKTLRFWGTFLVYLFFEGNKPSRGTDRGGEPSLGKSQSSWWSNQPIWNRLVKNGNLPQIFGVKIVNIFETTTYSNIFWPNLWLWYFRGFSAWWFVFLVTSGDIIPALIVSHIKKHHGVFWLKPFEGL